MSPPFYYGYGRFFLSCLTVVLVSTLLTLSLAEDASLKISNIGFKRECNNTNKERITKQAPCTTSEPYNGHKDEFPGESDQKLVNQLAVLEKQKVQHSTNKSSSNEASSVGSTALLENYVENAAGEKTIASLPQSHEMPEISVQKLVGQLSKLERHKVPQPLRRRPQSEDSLVESAATLKNSQQTTVEEETMPPVPQSYEIPEASVQKLIGQLSKLEKHKVPQPIKKRPRNGDSSMRREDLQSFPATAERDATIAPVPQTQEFPEEAVQNLVGQLSDLERQEVPQPVKRHPRSGDFLEGFGALLRNDPATSSREATIAPIPQPYVVFAPSAVAAAPVAALLAPRDPANPPAPLFPAAAAVLPTSQNNLALASPAAEAAANLAVSRLAMNAVQQAGPIALDAIGGDGGFRENGVDTLSALHAPLSPALLQVHADPRKAVSNPPQVAPVSPVPSAVGLSGAEGGGAAGRPGFAPLAWSGSQDFLRFPAIKGSPSPAPADNIDFLLRAAAAKQQVGAYLGRQLAPVATASPAGASTASALRPSGCCDTEPPPSRNANASAMLEKIMRQLHDIEAERDAGMGNREGLPCSPEGSWFGMVAGVRLDISCGGKGNANSGGSKSGAGDGGGGGGRGGKSGSGATWCADCGDGSLEVQLAAAVPACESALLSLDWQLRGHAPFSRSGLFTLWGADASSRRTVTFAGQCRVCGGADTITGQWMMSREPRDCRDTHMFLNEYRDVFRRETLHMLRQKRLRQLTASPASTPGTRGSCDFFHSNGALGLYDTALNSVTNIVKSSNAGVLPKETSKETSSSLPSETLRTPPPASVLFGTSPTVKPDTTVIRPLET